jgi:hypothetical protein
MADNGTIPRSERTCPRCDHSRRVGTELRCWHDRPQTIVVAVDPPLVSGGVPRLRTILLQNGTFPDYSCEKWIEMQSDHPDLRRALEVDLPEPTHPEPEGRQ